MYFLKCESNHDMLTKCWAVFGFVYILRSLLMCFLLWKIKVGRSDFQSLIWYLSCLWYINHKWWKIFYPKWCPTMCHGSYQHYTVGFWKVILGLIASHCTSTSSFFLPTLRANYFSRHIKYLPLLWTDKWGFCPDKWPEKRAQI